MRKSILIRISPELHDELNRWAKDELRSVNGQIEFLLRDAVERHRRPLKNQPLLPEEEEGNDDKIG